MNNFSLDGLISPLDKDYFFKDYFGEKYFHITREDKEYFKKLLSLSDIDAFLDRHNLFYPHVFLVKDGKNLPFDQYTAKGSQRQLTGAIIKDNIYKKLNEGSTLVINGLDNYIPQLKKLCNAVTKDLLLRTQCNLYTTVKQNSQGFDIHFDTHDVIIIQVHGSKTWKLYDCQQQPQYLTKKIWKKTAEEREGYKYDLIEEIELQQGDTLYLPRGLAHEALTSEEPSVHIAFGFIAQTWTDLFKQISAVAENNSVFRQNQPLHLSSAEDLAQFEKAFKNECLKLIENLDVISLVEEQKEELRKQIKPIHENRFTTLFESNALNISSRLKVKEGLLLTLKKEGFMLSLKFLNKELNFPLPLENSLKYIIETLSIKVADIPGNIKDKLRLEIVQRLMNEGVLEFENS